MVSDLHFGDELLPAANRRSHIIIHHYYFCAVSTINDAGSGSYHSSTTRHQERIFVGETTDCAGGAQSAGMGCHKRFTAKIFQRITRKLLRNRLLDVAIV